MAWSSLWRRHLSVHVVYGNELDEGHSITTDGRCPMKVYAGIDLHSTNNYLGVIDQTDRRLFDDKLPNCPKTILAALKPFKKKLVGIVVESTFNWYWLVDVLNENGYKVHLANPAAIKQYEGLKHSDDQRDSFWLAHMLRLGILPEGYIYPKAQRPLRDLLRRRGRWSDIEPLKF